MANIIVLDFSAKLLYIIATYKTEEYFLKFKKGSDSQFPKGWTGFTYFIYILKSFYIFPVSFYTLLTTTTGN